MKIDSSVISMNGTSNYVENTSKQENLNYWTGNQRPSVSDSNQNTGVLLPPLDILDLSDEGKAMLSKSQISLEGTQQTEDSVLDLSDRDKRKIKLLETLIEYLTGKKIKIHIPEKIKIDPDKLQFEFPAAPQRQGWGLDYSYHESYYEKQSMSFSSEGTVKTADGREINFSLNLSMTREFMTQQDIRVKAGDALIDPLAINFGSGIPRLTDQKFSFDIDSDGKADQVSFLTQGSGFLALDSNSDGIINNGKELFGPNTGNGFSDLAKFDSDGNNWIDKNDPIFDKLRIWTKEPDGTDRLFALGEKGIGAIYLGNVDTSFNLKNSSNDLNGEIKRTGIFLRENGSVGTVNHIDLVI